MSKIQNNKPGWTVYAVSDFQPEKKTVQIRASVSHWISAFSSYIVRCSILGIYILFHVFHHPFYNSPASAVKWKTQNTKPSCYSNCKKLQKPQSYLKQIDDINTQKMPTATVLMKNEEAVEKNPPWSFIPFFFLLSLFFFF